MKTVCFCVAAILLTVGIATTTRAQTPGFSVNTAEADRQCGIQSCGSACGFQGAGVGACVNPAPNNAGSGTILVWGGCPPSNLQSNGNGIAGCLGLPSGFDGCVCVANACLFSALQPTCDAAATNVCRRVQAGAC